MVLRSGVEIKGGFILMCEVSPPPPGMYLL